MRVIAVAAVIVGIVVLIETRSAPSPTIASGPLPTVAPVGAADLAHGRWITLPASPLVAASPNPPVWTGKEIVTWGTARTRKGFEVIGAAFDPKTGRWRRLAGPPSPWATMVGSQAAVWTGHELVSRLYAMDPRINRERSEAARTRDIHTTEAAFDPSTDRWRLLPPDPLDPHTDTVQLLWTGRAIVALGGPSDPSSHEIRMATYDPGTNRWRPLPDVPIAHGSGVAAANWPEAVWAGDRVLDWQGSSNPTGQPSLDLYSYSPRTDRWTRVDGSTGLEPRSFRPIAWTGSEAIAPGSMPYGPAPSMPVPFPGGVYDPGHNRYSTMKTTPLDARSQGDVWTGDALVRVSGGQSAFDQPPSLVGAAWNPSHDVWLDLPALRLAHPAELAEPVWTGTELIEMTMATFGRTSRIQLVALVPAARS